jgi:hypothetical protein
MYHWKLFLYRMNVVINLAALWYGFDQVFFIILEEIYSLLDRQSLHIRSRWFVPLYENCLWGGSFNPIEILSHFRIASVTFKSRDVGDIPIHWLMLVIFRFIDVVYKCLERLLAIWLCTCKASCKNCNHMLFLRHW